MNKDDSDFFRYVKKEPSSSSNIALDLINGLENRNYGNIKKNVKSKENIEVFAEEQFIRKKDFEEMRCEMPGQPRSTFLMVFSPDGSRVASTHGNHNIYITDILTGKHIRTLVGHPRTPWCIAFHPTSDQIVASGCLGGQVRIWDLSGGSEVWTAVNQTVIASLAFHPTDRVLVIATYNEIYFWDWSQPEPFVHVATSNPKEKVRFVAFDSLGHKLITGIANSPQTRWERVRAPVPVPRQERSVSPYRRRITQRLVSVTTNQQSQNISSPSQDSNTSNRESLSNVPARVRRITICYRNLVREYEQLVQRYLQLYRPPTMIDRGTDPMEPNESQSTSSENPGPSTSRSLNSNNESNSEPQPGPSTQVEPGPSSSQDNNTASSSSHLLAPSRIFSLAPVNKPTVLIRGTQTSESRKHKTNHDQTEPKGKRIKVSSNNAADNETVPENNAGTQENSTNNVQNESESASPFNSMLEDWRRGMARNNSNSNRNPNASSTSRFRINPSLYVDVVPPSTVNSDRRTSTELNDSHDNLTNDDRRQYSTNVDELLHNIRRTAEEEVRNRILPIIRSVPINDRPELIRLFENSREHVRMRFRQMYPTFVKKQTRRDRRNVNVVDTTSDSSSSDEDNSTSTTVDPRRSNDQSSSSLNNQNNTLPGNTTNTSASNTNPPSSSSTVRNFNTELEQLVTSLLTEIETDRTSSTSNSNLNTETTRQSQIANSTPQDSAIPVPREDASSIADQTETSSPSNRTMPFFQRFLQRRNTSVEDIPPPLSIRTPAFEPFPSDTDNGRASSPIFMNFIPRRRRFFSHRISAFMPTRVNYNRNSRLRRPTHTVGRGRLGLRNQNVSSLDVDELINYSERENSEEDTPQPLDLSNHTTPENGSVNNMYSNIRLGNVYSNIIHDLESSLSDVIRMRASNRPGETSDMLGSFSERLENIMQQSDTILRNLSHSMEMLSSSTEPNTHRTQSTEPSWSFFDQNFYVRDQRTENVSQDSSNREEVFNLSDIFNSRPPFINSATSDHTYPRIPENAHSSSQNEGISPLMTSIHMTISHIQRQARLLRRQVESIERIDRAMLEVAQLQLIRQLIIELVRHVRTLSGENRSTGMTSVRQMMAGTRISDSSPYESPSEDVTPQENNQTNTSSNTLNTEQSTSSNGPTRARSSHRKTYPPGRLFRFGRQSRRPSIINFFSRRYTRSERNPRTNPFSRLSAHEPCPNYTYINTYTLSSMTRRLQHLLIEQVQNLTPPPAQQHPQQERTNSRSTVDLGEHMLASRLHACLLRVNRLIGNNINVDPVENLYVGQPAAAVTQDGESRYRARHCLTMIIECMSRHIEELGNSSIQTNMRQQFHGVLVMSLLLTELLLLVIVDSIPPPTGINLIPERASLTSRIDHMVTQLLQSRFSHSHQLTRSLRLMKLTMRHAHTALGQTYQSRRNEMLPRINTNRQQVLGSINRCLRFINRQREQRETPPMDPNITSTNNLLEEPTSSNGNPNSQNPSTSNQDNANNSIEWYSNIYDFFIRRYSNNRDEDTDNRPSTSGRDRVVPQNDPSSTNDNTDGDDDETDGYNNNYIPHSTNSYRTNNVNVAGGSGQPPRIWNVPAVQVNDVPVSEPSTLTQRVINQRQRFAERVSELRSNPSVGLFRPRFLHPLYASVMNPFDADLDDPQREPLYDGDMITTVTPNHRIQAWDVSDWTVPMPEISDALKNVVVSECKIHNDASVDVAKDGTILVTLLPSGGYLNVTNKLGVYSLKWETLGQCLYITCFEQNAVSVSLSPLSRHLIVGLTHRIITNDRWVMARIFKIDQKDVPGDRLPVLRELEQSRDSRINCIRWLPISGQGLIYATNTGQLVVLS